MASYKKKAAKKLSKSAAELKKTKDINEAKKLKAERDKANEKWAALDKDKNVVNLKVEQKKADEELTKILNKLRSELKYDEFVYDNPDLAANKTIESDEDWYEEWKPEVPSISFKNTDVHKRYARPVYPHTDQPSELEYAVYEKFYPLDAEANKALQTVEKLEQQVSDATKNYLKARRELMVLKQVLKNSYDEFSKQSELSSEESPLARSRKKVTIDF